MRISLSPVIGAPPLVVTKAGDILTINGAPFDFSGLPDGATLPSDNVACEAICGDVERIDGELHIRLLLPCKSTSPLARRFPADLIDPPDGQIVFPGA